MHSTASSPTYVGLTLVSGGGGTETIWRL